MARNPGSADRKLPDRGRSLVAFYIAAFAAVIVGAVLLCIFVFFRVERVEVYGGDDYRLADILSVVDVEQGSNLVLLPTSWREKELTRRFPYIKTARIRKKLPSTIRVELTEAEVRYSVQTRDGYLYVDPDGKILEIEEYPAIGSITVRGASIKTPALSEQIAFEDEEMAEVMLKIGRALQENDEERISSIDLRSRFNITMTYDLRIVFRFGNLNDLDYKLDMGFAVLDQMLGDGSISPETRGEIDLTNTDLNFASFRAYSSTGMAGGVAGREDLFAVSAKPGDSDAEPEPEDGDG